MYSAANCSITEWEEINIQYQYVILDPEKMLVKDEKKQLVYVRGGTGCSPNTFGTKIIVEEVDRNNPHIYELNRYDYPIIGVANSETINYHKERYFL